MLPIYLVAAFLAGVRASLTYKGVDWSSLLVEEAQGYTYKNAAGVTEPLEKILVENGVNTVRQRLWVNPPDKNYNLDYNLKLGKRAQAAGLRIYLDIHFSDTWAGKISPMCCDRHVVQMCSPFGHILKDGFGRDRHEDVLIRRTDPANQKIPAGWPTDLSNLSWKAYNYTLDVSNAFQKAGIPLSIVSIGNEITSGLLFPTGKTSSFYNIATILHSASSGIKYSTLSPQPQIMIHLDNGWNWDTQKWWYTSLLAAGPFAKSDFDVMGVSYYPFYNPSATLASLKSSMKNMASTWGKVIMVAETDWPVSCTSPKYAFPSDASSIPKSVAGQTTWVKDVAAIVAGTSGGNGLFYWEPAWINNAGLGSSCGDNLMVDQNGKARSSLAVFASI